MAVELLLQGDDYALEALCCLLPDVVGHLEKDNTSNSKTKHMRTCIDIYTSVLLFCGSRGGGGGGGGGLVVLNGEHCTHSVDVGIVQGCVNLIQDKERRWLVAAQNKQCTLYAYLMKEWWGLHVASYPWSPYPVLPSPIVAWWEGLLGTCKAMRAKHETHL